MSHPLNVIDYQNPKVIPVLNWAEIIWWFNNAPSITEAAQGQRLVMLEIGLFCVINAGWVVKAIFRNRATNMDVSMEVPVVQLLADLIKLKEKK